MSILSALGLAAILVGTTSCNRAPELALPATGLSREESLRDTSHAQVEARIDSYFDVLVPTRWTSIGEAMRKASPYEGCLESDPFGSSSVVFDIWIADHHIVSTRVYGDSAIVKLTITSVARGYVMVGTGQPESIGMAKVEERLATLLLVRSNENPQWRVCGFPRVTSEDVVGVYPSPANDAWLPADWSALRVRAAIDSVRLARGKPLLR